MEIFVYDNQANDMEMINDKNVNLHRELEKTSADSLDISDVQSKDKLFYIYTSGTTGYMRAITLDFIFISLNY